MLSDLLNKIADAPRESVFLAAVLVLIGGLLTAMYMVCDAQVRTAQERFAMADVQRLAVRDCLDADPRASYAACASHVAVVFQSRPPAGHEAPRDAMAGGSAKAGAAVMAAGSGRSKVTALVPVAFSPSYSLY